MAWSLDATSTAAKTSDDLSLPSTVAATASVTYLRMFTLPSSSRSEARDSSVILVSLRVSAVHFLMEESSLLRSASVGRDGEVFAARSATRAWRSLRSSSARCLASASSFAMRSASARARSSSSWRLRRRSASAARSRARASSASLAAARAATLLSSPFFPPLPRPPPCDPFFLSPLPPPSFCWPPPRLPPPLGGMGRVPLTKVI